MPAGATVIDAAGAFVVPGFIDTNVHLSLYGGVNDRYETLVRYHDRQPEIVLEAAQLQLAHGVTTVRDSYGVLPPLVEVRERIRRGQARGARILAAGNIVGWGGPYSVSFSLIPERGLTLFQEQMNDQIAQGAGEDLVDMTPDELRTAINAYLDKGPDFIKFGGTAHFARPSFIGFSPEAQRVLVEEAHKRGSKAETHATTPDGLRLSIEAGIDLIQHPEMLGPRELPDALVATIVERRIVGSMLVNTITGEAWQKHLKDSEAAKKKPAEEAAKGPPRASTAAERRRDAADAGVEMEMRRAERPEADRRRRDRDASAPTTTGPRRRSSRARRSSRRRTTASAPSWPSRGWSSSGMTPMQALVAGDAATAPSPPAAATSAPSKPAGSPT